MKNGVQKIEQVKKRPIGTLTVSEKLNIADSLTTRDHCLMGSAKPAKTDSNKIAASAKSLNSAPPAYKPPAVSLVYGRNSEYGLKFLK